MPILLYENRNESKTDKEGKRIPVVKKYLVGELSLKEVSAELLAQLGTKGRQLWGISNFDHYEVQIVSEEEKWAINANRLLNCEKPIKMISLYNVIGDIDRKFESEKMKLFESQDIKPYEGYSKDENE